MFRIACFVLAAALAVAAHAESPAPAPLIRPAGDTDLPEFLWLARPVVVFADSPEDPLFLQQMELLAEGEDRLADRDVVVLFDTDPAARAPLRQRLRPRGFMMVLIGKDGEVELRKPRPWTVREITRSIDKMPNRIREVEERREKAG